MVCPCGQWEPAVLQAPRLEMLLLAQLLSGSYSGCWLSPPQLFSSFFQTSPLINSLLSLPWQYIVLLCLPWIYAHASKINNWRKKYLLDHCLDVQCGFELLGNAC